MKKDSKPLLENLLSNMPEDFFNQFKNIGELNSFMDKLFKRGVEQMLKSELSDYLGYDKHSKEGANSG